MKIPFEMINAAKQWLSSIFEMKDIGEGSYVLGVETTQNSSKQLLGLSEEAYLNRVLERFQMHYSKPMDTPVEKALTLSLDQCPKVDKEKERMINVPYASAVASLMYIMLCTRLDI